MCVRAQTGAWKRGSPTAPEKRGEDGSGGRRGTSAVSVNVLFLNRNETCANVSKLSAPFTPGWQVHGACCLIFCGLHVVPGRTFFVSPGIPVAGTTQPQAEAVPRVLRQRARRRPGELARGSRRVKQRRRVRN